ncbi:MAG: hypothetical protein RL846_21295 [Deltaproteobacteria bacterium]
MHELFFVVGDVGLQVAAGSKRGVDDFEDLAWVVDVFEDLLGDTDVVLRELGDRVVFGDVPELTWDAEVRGVPREELSSDRGDVDEEQVRAVGVSSGEVDRLLREATAVVDDGEVIAVSVDGLDDRIVVGPSGFGVRDHAEEVHGCVEAVCVEDFVLGVRPEDAEHLVRGFTVLAKLTTRVSALCRRGGREVTLSTLLFGDVEARCIPTNERFLPSIERRRLSLGEQPLEQRHGARRLCRVRRGWPAIHGHRSSAASTAAA